MRAARAGTSATRARGRRLAVPALVAPVALALSSCAGVTGVTGDGVALERAAPPVPRVVAAATPVVDRPAVVSVPAVGVSARLVPLGLDANGALEAPQDYAVAGWYADGPEPGERGPTVIAGHVDSVDGPGAFYGLRDVEPGDRVDVIGADGSSLQYVVQRVEQHPKGEFPTDAVYGTTPASTLRLITCGGDFDRTVGHYRDNIVVFAELAAAG